MSPLELSTVPPRPTTYPNRDGVDPDLPLTRLPVHNPPDRFPSVFRSSRNVFDLLRYIAGLYIYRILNRITCSLHLQFRNNCNLLAWRFCPTFSPWRTKQVLSAVWPPLSEFPGIDGRLNYDNGFTGL